MLLRDSCFLRAGAQLIDTPFPFAHLQLCDLYENDSIFDKFECCISGNGLRAATGSYRYAPESRACFFTISIIMYTHIPSGHIALSSNMFRVFGVSPGSTESATLEASRNPMR